MKYLRLRSQEKYNSCFLIREDSICTITYDKSRGGYEINMVGGRSWFTPSLDDGLPVSDIEERHFLPLNV